MSILHPGRRRRRRLERAAWLIRAAALIILLIPDPAAGQVIRGRVLDAQSGAGVELAQVAVVGHRLTQRTTTAADGRFSVRLPRGGSFRVQVARTGYAETRTHSLAVGPRDTVDVDVRVSAAAHRLDPLTVAARPRRLKVIGVFHESSDTVSARVRAVGQARSIRVRGTFPTPSLCYHLSGSAYRRESVVTLAVQARATGDFCGPAAGGFAYDMTVRGLPPGSYTLHVLHTWKDDVQPPVLLQDTTVTVP